MNGNLHCTSWASAGLTALVALLAVYIAWRQWRTAQNKLKFDLFDRRFSVYEASRNLWGLIMQHGKVRDEDVRNYLPDLYKAKWLLNDEVAEYLEKEFYRKITDLQLFQRLVEDALQGEEKRSNREKQGEIMGWLAKQHEVLDKKFTPFLKLQH